MVTFFTEQLLILYVPYPAIPPTELYLLMVSSHIVSTIMLDVLFPSKEQLFIVAIFL